MSHIKIILDPKKREQFIKKMSKIDGVPYTPEDPCAAYCPLSLTYTPDELKPIVSQRQQTLMNDILKPAGISAYDPASAPYSPDVNLYSLPSEVYAVDISKVISSRFFVGNDILPSTGVGVETGTAKIYSRIAVILKDKSIRVSRMQPHRMIYLQYDNLEKQKKELIKVFKLLQQYEPGIGFNGHVPALLGFDKKNSDVVDLEELIYNSFPHLQYKYEGTVPILKFRVENPELFYEHTNV